MFTETSEEHKAVPFTAQQVDWDEWSKKYQRNAAERGYLKVMLDTERVPLDALNIDWKVDNTFGFPEDERKQKHHARK